ncbi:MAG: light-independent protochlorophyllide reductase subunit B [Methanoregula sp. PtaU1.Bin051]|nr:MAG: light-independent protochlorophyllide reductase subunit B [Methanoregula sp. PtaU1.Bin051]
MPSNPSPSNSCRFEGCTLTGALSVTTSVCDSISVVHGPSGCAHHNFSLLHTTGIDNDRITFPRLVSSGMQDAEIVFGGEEALERAIRSAVSDNASVIYVLSTCIAETIGDDVKAVCSRDWGVPVIPIPTAGFLGGSFQKGVNNALLAVAGSAPISSQGVRLPGLVNIIGEKNLEFEVEENYREVVRLLSLLGLRVNLRFVHRIRADEIARLGSASFNILRDEDLGVIGEELSRRFGTPAVTSFPAGFSGTLKFLETAAGIYGADPAEAIAKERQVQEFLIRDFADIAGLAISADHLVDGSSCNLAVREITGLLDMEVVRDGARVPIPPVPPVGTTGIKRMLHRWRRAVHA